MYDKALIIQGFFVSGVWARPSFFEGVTKLFGNRYKTFRFSPSSGVLPIDTQLSLPAIPRLRVQNTIDLFQTTQREAERCHASQASIKKRSKRWRITRPGTMPQRCGAGRSFEDVRRCAGKNDIAPYWLGTGDIPFRSGDTALSHGHNQEKHCLLDTG
ncbi:hypothetical protein F6R97_04035 [Pseudomonas sp. JV414]|uniref:hypothetical protein n=1 Tax=Pseudomonas sp. JV414 TaxID=1733110 RepID=UPI0028E166B2|nr:hypothetical protein [Pseudomonas sp. JV414]MDT9673824.1 hypothetical protein [Pseudomonas sp. JV414]